MTTSSPVKRYSAQSKYTASMSHTFSTLYKQKQTIYTSSPFHSKIAGKYLLGDCTINMPPSNCHQWGHISSCDTQLRWSLLMWEIGRRLGYYGDHPRPHVADRGTSSRVDKRVAPGGCRGQTLPRRRKTLITISDHKPRGRQEETTSAISQDSISIRISRTCSTAEDWRERDTQLKPIQK